MGVRRFNPIHFCFPSCPLLCIWESKLVIMESVVYGGPWELMCRHLHALGDFSTTLVVNTVR